MHFSNVSRRFGLDVSYIKGGELLCLELLSLHKKRSFPLRISSVTFPADLLTFTEQIPNQTLYFLCGLHTVFANFE